MNPADISRLKKLVALFDSPAEGERNNAVAMAGELLKRHNKTMLDLGALLAEPTKPGPSRRDSHPSPSDFAEAFRQAARAAAAERERQTEAARRQQEAIRRKLDALEAEEKARRDQAKRDLDRVRAMAAADGHPAPDTWAPRQCRTFARTRLVSAIRERAAHPQDCPGEPINPYLMPLRMAALKRLGASVVEHWLHAPNARLEGRRPIDVAVTKKGAVLCTQAMKPDDVLAMIPFGTPAIDALRTIADERLGGWDMVELWMKSTNPLLGMRRPIDVAGNDIRLCAEALDTKLFRGRKKQPRSSFYQPGAQRA